MKKIILILIVLFIVNKNINAASDLFVFDENRIENELQEATELNNLVEDNSANFTIEKITNFNSFDFNKPLVPTNDIWENMKWGAFAWGFCCYPVGCLVIFLDSNRTNDDYRSYFIGLGANFALGVIAYVVFVAVAVSSSMFYW